MANKSDSFDENLSEEEDEEEEEVEMTAADLLTKLKEAWQNEKFAPELLETKIELVECMLEQLKHMEDNIKSCKKGDFRIILHRIEIDRIRYVISSYLRIRLKKIEDYVDYILENERNRKEDEPARLSPEELTYAREFCKNKEEHFKSVVLNHMPPNLQGLEKEKTIFAPKPNMDSYIFLKVNENQEQVLIEPETDEQQADVVDFEKGAQHIMKYRPIASLVASDAISLI
ncbi:DNA replication complex GINS protein SLD5-like [Anneissia japonica]|uniref:DNA replication complex GINS protein SLD5-like n=1 Tax=Anneissia japonica TaxID=1529436 RepID=UPI0014256E01|nr:DNA replication complex GINS protein SLD5-like [Anneissia japonica]